MIVLIVGGTRSGKSQIGEHVAARLATRRGAVTVIVPTTADDHDPELRARIARHRARRPATWTTVECGHQLPEALDATTGIALVDSLGTWVARSADCAVPTARLVAALRARRAPTVVVTEEVGLAVHPPTALGRRFADAVGELNAAVAAVADRALLAVAGRAVDLQPAVSSWDPV